MGNHEENSVRPESAEEAGPTTAGRIAGQLGRWGDLAVGTAAETEEATLHVFAALRSVVSRRRRAVSDRAVAGATGVRRRITELADRGAAERARGRGLLAAGLDAAVAAVATSPVLEQVVDAQLERVLRPVVGAVLDDIVDMLEREPERIRSLVRSQRTTMVDEVVSRVRSGAAAGDGNVDRLTSRVLHQGPPAPPPSEPQ
jgi:hypothetical protein